MEYKKECNCIIETAEKMDLEKLWWTKKIKAQNRLKNIKNNTILETLTKKDTIYKKFTYLPWANNKFQKIFKEFNITLAPINKFNIKKRELQR